MRGRITLGALAGALLLVGPAGAADKLLVDDDLAQCPAAQFTSIQAAVTAAAAMPGDQEIEVCSGTYDENVSIGPGNSVYIFGHGTDKTFVTGVPGTAGPIFDAQSSGTVAIEKLTVDGGSLQAGPVVMGIRYAETNGRIKDTAVLNIRDASGGAQGVAIRVQSSGAPTSVRVEDNRVEYWTRVGVSANGLGVDTVIEDNLIVGPLAPKVWAPNGVQVSRGSIGVVVGNEVRGASIGLEPPNAGSGILLFCAGPTRVEGNEIFASDTGVNLEDNAGAHVIGNVVADSVYDAYPLLGGVGAFFGDPVGGLGCPGGAQATVNNVHEGNKASTSGRDGVTVQGFAGAVPAGNRILNTDVKESGRDGIGIRQGTDNVIEDNKIKQSGEHDAHDDTVGSGNGGTANFWTDNDCKTPPPNDQNRPGLCDA